MTNVQEEEKRGRDTGGEGEHEVGGRERREREVQNRLNDGNAFRTTAMTRLDLLVTPQLRSWARNWVSMYNCTQQLLTSGIGSIYFYEPAGSADP
jgi:hypothetical protein